MSERSIVRRHDLSAALLLALLNLPHAGQHIKAELLNGPRPTTVYENLIGIPVKDMPFSHHSHSGQFCGHAKNELEEVVQEAIAKGMEVFCMTEHMPRDYHEDLYDEEVAAGVTPAQLSTTFEQYLKEARRLQHKYHSQIRVLVGIETEWIRPQTCHATIQRLVSAHGFDMLVGSVHHVHTIPIDFSQELYDKAVAAAAEKRLSTQHDAGKSERFLVADYFDLQYDMLVTLKPPVVGHFDLIRLLSSFEREGKTLREWPDVWEKVKRNLETVKRYGGCLEINSAGLRKGLREPYPSSDICKAFLAMGGKFVLSDDSHGISQVATCYAAALEYIRLVGISELAVFDIDGAPSDSRFKASAQQNRRVNQLGSTKFVSLLHAVP